MMTLLFRDALEFYAQNVVPSMKSSGMYKTHSLERLKRFSSHSLQQQCLIICSLFGFVVA